MTALLIPTLCVAAASALLLAGLLFWVARLFPSREDPRIDGVLKALPGANCGGCGQPGCRAFAEQCVRATTMNGLFCPVGGNETMATVAGLLGREPESRPDTVAVLRCNGGKAARPLLARYDGPPSCAAVHALFSGEAGCAYGCLWFGDCVNACAFGAMTLDPVSGLPVIREDRCTSCGACVAACPRQLIEVRPKGPGGHRFCVLCRSHDKGPVAIKGCRSACIGCGKCVKACPHDAITMTGPLAVIDDRKCVRCGACVPVCPTRAIHEEGRPA